MCGRYATTRSAADLSTLFEALDETDGQVVPDYNVAPTDPVPIIRTRTRPEAREPDGRRPGARELDDREPDGREPGAGEPATRAVSVARWGLVPHWAKDPRIGARMINARAETIATAPAFARAFQQRRCLVPMDGWYEWRHGGDGTRAGDGSGGRDPGGSRVRSRRPDGNGRQAYFMTPKGGGVLACAGIWTTSGAGLLTFSVVTTAAVGELTRVHDRMPLLLPADRWTRWLVGSDLVGPRAEDLLDPPGVDFLASLEVRPVGPGVGNVRNDGPQLIDRVSVTPAADFGDDPTDGRLF